MQMNLPYPYLGLSAQRLTDWINSDNSTSYQLGVDFTFSGPALYTDSLGRNTKVTMQPADSTKYASTDIHYWRLPLTILNNLPQGNVNPVPIPQLPFSIHGILDAINTALGLNLTPDEVPDQTFTTELASYPLHINDAVSLAWIDSDFQFQPQFMF